VHDRRLSPARALVWRPAHITPWQRYESVYLSRFSRDLYPKFGLRTYSLCCQLGTRVPWYTLDHAQDSSFRFSDGLAASIAHAPFAMHRRSRLTLMPGLDSRTPSVQAGPVLAGLHGLPNRASCWPRVDRCESAFPLLTTPLAGGPGPKVPISTAREHRRQHRTYAFQEFHSQLASNHLAMGGVRVNSFPPTITNLIHLPPSGTEGHEVLRRPFAPGL